MDLFDLRHWAFFAQAGGSLETPALIDQVTIDSRDIHSSKALFIALKGTHTDGHHYVIDAAKKGAQFALVSQEWNPETLIPNLTLLRVDDPLKALQSIAKTYRKHLPTKLLGIGGSFGKTMVKDLLHAILATSKTVAASPGSFNSQIGVPLSLFRLQKHHEIGLIEAAISQPQEMDILAELIEPDYTLLTPLGRKHLATLKNLSNLYEETEKLVKSTSEKGWTLMAADDYSTHSHASCKKYFWNYAESDLPHAVPCMTSPLTHYLISFSDGASHRGKIKFGQTHFLNLINMATKAAWLLGSSSQEIISVLKDYEPEMNRTEIWKSTQGALFINDTSASDPQSLEIALQAFETYGHNKRRLLVFSGMKESFERDITRVAHSIIQSKIEHLLLVKQPSSDIVLLQECLKTLSPSLKISCFDSHEACFDALKTFLEKKDTVLLKGRSKLNLDSLMLSINESLSNSLCTINLAAIRENLQLIRSRLPKNTRIMAMVKAFAYGTDDIQISKFLKENGVDILGVSYVDEAISLKKAGVSQKIFSLNAAPYEVKKSVKWDIEIGVSDEEFVSLLEEEAKAQQKMCSVHIHVNTGMGRFGSPPHRALSLATHISRCPHLVLEGIMTHFASAEDPQEDHFTWNQIQCFNHVIQEIENAGIVLKWKHAANSSGAIRFHLPEYNMVRLGLAMYGLYTSNTVQQTLDLKLAVSLTSRIVGITHCERGDSIGYGRKYLVHDTYQKIAILPIGYFDGLHRSYSSKGSVWIRGHKASMVGNICMDYMMVDVTAIPNVQVGDSVLIFGENEHGDYLSPEDFALSGNSIIHELITCLGPRITRLFIYEEGNQIR